LVGANVELDIARGQGLEDSSDEESSDEEIKDQEPDNGKWLNIKSIVIYM